MSEGASGQVDEVEPDPRTTAARPASWGGHPLPSPPGSILSLMPACLCSFIPKLWSGVTEMDQRTSLCPKEHPVSLQRRVKD